MSDVLAINLMFTDLLFLFSRFLSIQKKMKLSFTRVCVWLSFVA